MTYINIINMAAKISQKRQIPQTVATTACMKQATAEPVFARAEAGHASMSAPVLAKKQPPRVVSEDTHV